MAEVVAQMEELRAETEGLRETVAELQTGLEEVRTKVRPREEQLGGGLLEMIFTRGQGSCRH